MRYFIGKSKAALVLPVLYIQLSTFDAVPSQYSPTENAGWASSLYSLVYFGA